MTVVLLTGFEPFAGDRRNPSWDAVDRVAAEWSGLEIVSARLLPVEFGRAGDLLDAMIDDIRPDLVIATGLATGRARVSLERVAINVQDARIADNAGVTPVDKPVIAGEPAAYFTGLPIKAALTAALGDGLPVAVSSTAGTFVCNDVFFRLQHRALRDGFRSGFVHVPAVSGAAGTPTLPIAEIVRTLASIVRTSIDVREDIGVEAGTLA